MAAQGAQWLELEGELIAAIVAITPNLADTKPFKWREHKVQAGAMDIRAAAGATRLFQFTTPLPDVPDMGIGHTSRHKELAFDLQVIYPGGPIWAVYAADDADALAHAIRATTFTYADYVNPFLDEGGASLLPINDEDDGASGWVLTVPFIAPIQVS